MKTQNKDISESITTDASVCDRVIRKRELSAVRQKLRLIQNEATKELPSDKAKKIKQFEKPDKEVLYLSKSSLVTKLVQFSTRIDVGKYRTLIEVSSDKSKPKAQIAKKSQNSLSDKEYLQIYRQYLEDTDCDSPLRTIKKLLKAEDHFEERCDVFQKTNQKLIQWKGQQSPIKQRNIFSRSEFLQSECGDVQKKNSKLSYEYEFLALQQKNPIHKLAANPELIIKDRFQRKFYRQRRMKRQQFTPSKDLTAQHEMDVMNRSILTDQRLSKFLEKQSQIMDNSSKVGICEENKKKLQNRLEDIFYEIHKPQTPQKAKRNSGFVSRKMSLSLVQTH